MQCHQGGKKMYQKYSIGTMAKLMGISSEAIRYYESRNIISPVRDPETGYRYYNTWDFHMLLRARHYQNYGFSLEEIAELFRSHELAEIRGKMVDQEEMIQQEIIRQMNDEEAVYSLAFNDSASYRRQWQEIPQVVKERLHMSVIFADKKGNIVEL